VVSEAEGRGAGGENEESTDIAPARARRVQASRLVAIRQARLKKLALIALATRELSTGERRRAGKNPLIFP